MEPDRSVLVLFLENVEIQDIPYLKIEEKNKIETNVKLIGKGLFTSKVCVIVIVNANISFMKMAMQMQRMGIPHVCVVIGGMQTQTQTFTSTLSLNRFQPIAYSPWSPFKVISDTC